MIAKRCHPKKDKQIISARDYSDKNVQKFNNKLAITEWQDIYNTTDTETAYSLFHKKFCKVYNECFPLKSFEVKYKTRKPWLTPGLKISIKKKNKLFLLQKKKPFLFYREKYKKYRNILNNLLIKAERHHYDRLFSDHKNNSSKLWTHVKEIINKNKSNNNKTTKYIISNGKTVTDSQVISDTFNTFFTNIGLNLSNNIPKVNISPTSYIHHQVTNTIFLNEVSVNEVQTVIQNLKESSPGWDNIAPKIIKMTYEHFILPLTYIIHLSLTNGVFPGDLKIAKIIPLYKAKEKHVLNNYRPVSVLPVFSKIIERIMYNRIFDFINKNKILYKFQFGFQPNYSTSYAMITLIERITEALDNGNHVLGVFLDFSKAFDTVDHRILLQKLQCYGIRGLALEWISNYLSNRKQFVVYDNCISEKHIIKCGVPQGSILGPLLFLLYINDIASISDKIFLLLFADDSNAFVSGKNLDETIDTMNMELNKLVTWLNVNKLSLNIEKTHYMLFTNNKNLNTCKTVKINNISISKLSNIKFLGVILDDQLKWKTHISYIKSKVSKCIGILLKAKKYLNKSTLTQLYYSFLYPHLSYCIEVWGNTYNCYLETLYKVQKKAVRIILNASKYENSHSLFKKINILKLSDIYQYFISIFMFKYVNDKLPLIFKDMFVLNSCYHDYNARQCNLFSVPKCKLQARFRSVKYNGVKVWNNIMNNISIRCSNHTFKYKVKQYLLSIY